MTPPVRAPAHALAPTSPPPATPAVSARIADPSILDVEAVASALGADPKRGLSAAQAAQRLSVDGPNALRRAPPVPAWRRLLAQFQDPLVYLLLVAVLISLGAWWLEGMDGWPLDAVVIGAILLANGLLGYLQEARAQDAVAALARMTAVTSSVVRDGQLLRVPSEELVRGDLLVLAEGDAVGADARLFDAAALRVNEASLTGESEAVLKSIETLPAPASIGDRLDMVFKGTAIAQGSGRALVTATGMDSEMGAIAGMLEATVEERTPLQKEVQRIGRMLGIAVIAIAAVVVGSIVLMTELRTPAEWVQVLLLGVSLAVAAVPEGLPAILSVVLAIGVQRMAARKAIVKKLSSVETLGSASVIASDKTGTLTRSEMTIERIATASGESHVNGIGYAPLGSVEHKGEELRGPLRAEQVAVLSGGCVAGNAQLRQEADGRWEIQGDPTEAAFLVAERKLGVEEHRQARFERIREIPFSSERKMMSAIALDREHGGAPVLIAKGAPDVLLGRCTRARVGDEILALDAPMRARILADVERMTDDALRTLSVAYRPLEPGEEIDGQADLEQDLVFVGTVGMIDPPRTEAAPAIAEAHKAGIRVIMITGDHPGTAVRIATDLGIVEAGAAVLTGSQIAALDDAAFAEAVRRTSVYARVAPEHKLRIVGALQADGNVVAMTGDGVNDAPALKAADIGVAMGITGTEVSKEAARMILADDNFATIVHAVREGRSILDNIRKFLRYLLSSNMGEVLTVFLGVVLAGVIGLAGPGGAIAAPLLATQILWVNLITDSGPALAMGVDPAVDDVMARKPRRIDERVIDARMWFGVLEVGAVMAVVTLLTIDLYLPGGLLEGTESLDNARTAGFTVLVLAQLFNCLNARSENASGFRDPFANGWLWAAIALSAVLQVAVVNLGFLNAAFGTVPLSLEQWGVCVAMASVVLWATELRKLIARALDRRGARAGPAAAPGAGG
ncbi:cation-translocating P-type ATPase [Quisquiliibacterium transsilvanicum]|uniref:Magnesium-transporting ATPase (P-type) n=1 Tax=Quisquiliibacterium transsilvanicum TaxID=1549638 RepID=A0A7W8HEE1_9BURK|nr:cation-translocating P-type ATPase [Quisquiliibacterium transsilvanicum]MBB5270378.1 magnesium-transporting ATPase (P-type) [Quisquiliibacterium transsilvanicum]